MSRSSPPEGLPTASPWPLRLRLGAEGVQMGTRMVSAAESPVHDNYKHLIRDADATDTVMLSAHTSPALRVMRTTFSENLEQEPSVVMGRTVGMEGVLKLYFQGDLNAAFAFGGQVAGRVDEILPVEQIVYETVGGFYDVVQRSGRIPSVGVMVGSLHGPSMTTSRGSP